MVTHFGSLPCTVFFYYFFKRNVLVSQPRGLSPDQLHITSETALSSRQDYRAVTGAAIIPSFELCHITEYEPKPSLLLAEPNGPTGS